MTDTSRCLHHRNKCLSQTVESTLALLALYIIPLSPKVDDSSLGSDFKAWLSEWNVLWQTAKQRFMDAMYIYED
ncbi:hypothetical protein PGTUg99_036283 [Puccinia graminis f. sp. tritici]|uniref:Uncharacterized protein n=1 Tax=Puccinia graminis f. sp. tritici TaxID=56615 RepID=A0A5B0SMG1_PUCGR|nr:hypothetical protein PGTUg99_036283 [Puccinia graminis f. sp. tritici]